MEEILIIILFLFAVRPAANKNKMLVGGGLVSINMAPLTGVSEMSGTDVYRRPRTGTTFGKSPKAVEDYRSPKRFARGGGPRSAWSLPIRYGLVLARVFAKSVWHG